MTAADSADARPTVEADSHLWADEDDRFDRLFRAGFGDDLVVQEAVERVEQLIEPPAVVDAALHGQAWKFCEGMKHEAAAQFGQLYYSCMRAGFSAAEAVLHARGIAVVEVDDAVFEERLAALTRQFAERDPFLGFSDLAFYLLDDITPSIREHVEELLRTVVPDAELPAEWEIIPPLRMPLDMSISGMLFAAAAAMAAAGQDRL